MIIKNDKKKITYFIFAINSNFLNSETFLTYLFTTVSLSKKQCNQNNLNK